MIHSPAAVLVYCPGARWFRFLASTDLTLPRYGRSVPGSMDTLHFPPLVSQDRHDWGIEIMLVGMASNVSNVAALQFAT